MRRYELDEFWNKKTKKCNNGCIEWTGYKDDLGYGREPCSYWFKFFKCSNAHQFAYKHKKGWYDSNVWCVLHKCNNASCVNPDHLYLGTYKDNSRDMFFNKNNTLLNEEDILDIFDTYRKYKKGCLDNLAAKYNTSKQAIVKVLKKQSYTIFSKSVSDVEINSWHKLSFSEVTDIRKKYPRMSLQKLALEYNVDKSMISLIVNNKRRCHK